MLNWMKRRGPTSYLPRERDAEPRPATSGKYPFLYKYLHDRFADTVVLTFEQIESLLGCALPDQARLDQQWWTNGAGTVQAPSTRIAGSRRAGSRPRIFGGRPLRSS